jgi:hypothetical protein
VDACYLILAFKVYLEFLKALTGLDRFQDLATQNSGRTSRIVIDHDDVRNLVSTCHIPEGVSVIVEALEEVPYHGVAILIGVSQILGEGCISLFIRHIFDHSIRLVRCSRDGKQCREG